jgi:hypothetical protein
MTTDYGTYITGEAEAREDKDFDRTEYWKKCYDDYVRVAREYDCKFAILNTDENKIINFVISLGNEIRKIYPNEHTSLTNWITVNIDKFIHNYAKEMADKDLEKFED